MSHASGRDIHVGYHGDFKIRFGSDPSCDHIVPQLPGIAAGLKRSVDRLFVKDYGDKLGVTINGKDIRKKHWVEVTRYDKIIVYQILLNLSPKVFLGRDVVDLDSSPLRLILPNGKILCDGAYIRAKNGTVTAIMGPAGAGKTLFLNMLNGYKPPSEGKVLINRQLDLQLDYINVRDFIGYVPQDDIMIPELTLQQSLNYRLRLRYPDMPSSVRKSLIKGTCESLGFQGNQLNDFLNTVIGSPESGICGLSGGEKRRANIAHELVLKPLLLILDEPTSGLSSVDAEHVVKLLHDLARQNSMTIIATIHQPSRDVFKLFDDLLLISLGGKVAYYGKADKAVSYFEKTTRIFCGTRNPPEYIMSFLSEEHNRSRTVTQFERILGLVRAGSQEYDYIHDFDSKSLSQATVRQSGKKVLKFHKIRALYQNYRQWLVLLHRNLHVLFKDKMNFFLLFGQVPIIAILILFAFHNFGHDNEALDGFARKIYFFGQLKEPFEQQNKSVPVDSLLRQAGLKANDEPYRISEFGSRQRGAVYFMLVAASIWFGIIGGCKEIAAEQHILMRELRSYVHLLPCLLAKISMLILVVGFQTAILAAIVAPILLTLPFTSTLLLWTVLWTSAIASAALGLCVSCFSPTYRFALTAVPLLLIPQLVFGGLIRPLANLQNGTHWPQFIGSLTIQRWAFQASLSADTFGESGVLMQLVDFDQLGATKRYAELNIIRYTDSSIIHSFFHKTWGDPFLMPMGCLLIFSTVFLCLSYWRLKRKFLL